MDHLVLLFFFFSICSCSTVEVTGYVKGLSYAPSLSLASVGSIVAEEIRQHIDPSISVTLETIENGRPDLIFIGRLSSKTDEVISKLATISLPTVRITQWRTVKQGIAVSQAAASNVICQNGGTMRLDNKTCDCLPFAYGNNCQYVTCQNEGVRSLGANPSCTCPPGFEGRFCETRGCRPPIQGNRVTKKRTFAIVMTATASMKQTKEDLANSVIDTVNALQANEADYFEDFVFLVITGNGNNSDGVEIGSTENLTEFPGIIRTMDIISDTPQDTFYQPVINGVTSLLMYYPLHPDSIVLVFTDRMEQSPYDEDFLPSSNQSPYLALAKRALHWKAKIFFYLIQDGPIPMDPTSTHYDAFHQMATFTHGEVFPIKRANISNIMKNEVTHFYKPQNFGVRKHAKCVDIIMDVAKDSDNQMAYFLITADQNPKVPGPFTNKFYLTPTAQGVVIIPTFQSDYYALFSLFPNWTLPFPNGNEAIRQVRLGIASNSSDLTCSVTAFVSSDLTALFTHSDVNTIDGGDVFDFVEKIKSSGMTGTTFGFAMNQANFATYYPVDLITGASQSNGNSYLSSPRGSSCSFELSLPGPSSCQLGSYGQFFLLPVTNTMTITRVLPGLCVHHAHTTTYLESSTPAPNVTVGKNSCYQMNKNDLQEPRLAEFKQIVFVVETSLEMNKSVANLLQILSDVVKGIEDSAKLEKQYTLVTFDINGWAAQLDEYSASTFISKATKVLTSLMKTAKAVTNAYRVYSCDAVYGAQQLKIKSPQIMHVFTGANSGTVVKSFLLSPDVQVNFYQINDDLTKNVTFPLANEALQTQSNGRFMDITSDSVLTMSDLLVDATFENNLVFSGAMEDCSADTNTFYVDIEPAATTLSILAVGKDIGTVDRAFWLGDGGSVLIPTNDNTQMIKTANSLAVKLDLVKLQSEHRGWPGNWTIIISNVSGPCYLQVRVQSSLNMAIGFISDLASDFPNKMPYARWAQNGMGNFSIAARVVSSPVILDTVTLENIPNERPWDTEIFKNLTTRAVFSMRDQSMCSYQFISSPLTLPMQWALRVTISGRQTVDKTDYGFQRTFFYSNFPPSNSHCSSHTNPTAPLLPTGQCNCDVGYTGEFCENPICSNQGTSNFGICACQDGYTGAFCEQTYFNDSAAITQKPWTQESWTHQPDSAMDRGVTAVLLVLFIGYCSNSL